MSGLCYFCSRSESSVRCLRSAELPGMVTVGTGEAERAASDGPLLLFDMFSVIRSPYFQPYHLHMFNSSRHGNDIRYCWMLLCARLRHPTVLS